VSETECEREAREDHPGDSEHTHVQVVFRERDDVADEVIHAS